MIASKLIIEVRKFKGPIYMEVQNFNDCFWVQVVKTDLLAMIKGNFDMDFETGFILDEKHGAGYFGKDYDSND
jgi:hypothetical protein